MDSEKGLLKRIKGRLARDARRAGLLAMDIVIAALCLVLVFALWFAAQEFMDAGDEGYRGYALHGAMTGERYADLLELSNVNRALRIGEGAAEYEEYYAAADYFEACSNYYMYQRAGDRARAEKWKSRMEDAGSRLGSLSAEKQKIEVWLGMEE